MKTCIDCINFTKTVKGISSTNCKMGQPAKDSWTICDFYESEFPPDSPPPPPPLFDHMVKTCSDCKRFAGEGKPCGVTQGQYESRVHFSVKDNHHNAHASHRACSYISPRRETIPIKNESMDEKKSTPSSCQNCLLTRRNDKGVAVECLSYLKPLELLNPNMWCSGVDHVRDVANAWSREYAKEKKTYYIPAALIRADLYDLYRQNVEQFLINMKVGPLVSVPSLKRCSRALQELHEKDLFSQNLVAGAINTLSRPKFSHKFSEGEKSVPVQTLKSIIRLADTQLNQDVEDFGGVKIDLKEALVQLQAQEKDEATLAAAKDVLSIIKAANVNIEDAVARIRSYQTSIKATKDGIRQLNRAKAYGIATSNFVPLAIHIGALKEYEVDNKELLVIDDSLLPANWDKKPEVKVLDLSLGASTAESTEHEPG